MMQHGPDFRSVRFGDELYTFTRLQSQAVEIWWQAMDVRCSDVGDDFVLEKIEASIGTSLAQLFRVTDSDGRRVAHPAWGVMILPGSTRGTHKISAENLSVTAVTPMGQDPPATISLTKHTAT